MIKACRTPLSWCGGKTGMISHFQPRKTPGWLAGSCRDASVFGFALFIYLCAPGSVRQGALWIFDDNLEMSKKKKKTLSGFFISSIFQVCCGRWHAADNECSLEWWRNLHVHRSNQSRRDEHHCPAHRTGWGGFVNNREASVTRYDTNLDLNSPRTAGMPCVCCCRCSRCPPESRNIWNPESQEHQPVVGAGQRSQQLGYR